MTQLAVLAAALALATGCDKPKSKSKTLNFLINPPAQTLGGAPIPLPHTEDDIPTTQPSTPSTQTDNPTEDR